jgi:hypothetical protein
VIVLDFDFSALRWRDLIVAGGAIALFVFLFFFKWFGLSTSFGGFDVSHSANGWHVFTTSRWVWLITIVVALGVVVQRGRRRELRLLVPRGAIVAGLGALSTLLILYRIVHHPGGSGTEGTGVERYSYSFGIRIGIWLALLAAAAIAYGGYLAMQAEGISSLADLRDHASQALSRANASLSSSSESSASAPADPPAPPAAATAPGPPAGNGDE